MNQEGLNLKIALWVRRITQEELAQRTGINGAIISLAATGKYNLGLQEKARIAAVLNASPEEIFENSRHHA